LSAALAKLSGDCPMIVTTFTTSAISNLLVVDAASVPARPRRYSY
jgi:hypothetical protein